MPHDQPGLGLAAQAFEGFIHLGQAGQDEGYPAVTPGQGRQDVGIEHKSDPHFAAAAQGRVQGGVVVGA